MSEVTFYVATFTTDGTSERHRVGGAAPSSHIAVPMTAASIVRAGDPSLFLSYPLPLSVSRQVSSAQSVRPNGVRNVNMSTASERLTDATEDGKEGGMETAAAAGVQTKAKLASAHPPARPAAAARLPFSRGASAEPEEEEKEEERLRESEFQANVVVT